MPATETPAEAWRKPAAAVVTVVLLGLIVYILVHAFSNYQGGSQACAIRGAQRGIEALPSACKFPVFPIVYAVLLLIAGERIVGKLLRG